MTTQDLSLLTDDEIVDALAISAGSTATSVDETEEEEVRMYSSEILRRLIAARAEKNRLQECLRHIAADGDPQFAAAGERPFAMPMTPENEQAKDLWLYIGGVHRRAKAALLQSEKGGG